MFVEREIDIFNVKYVKQNSSVRKACSVFMPAPSIERKLSV
jgi:hypothetical protein